MPTNRYLLDRYIGLAALRSIVLLASGLTALFSLLEFVDQLHDVGQGDYRVADALIYVLLTVPGRLLRLVPVSMLLGTLFALGNMSGDSELIAMQAGGVSPRRIAASVLKIGVPIVAVLFLLAEFVIPTGQRLAQAQRMSKMSVGAKIENGNGFWVQSKGQYLNVHWVDYGNVPRDIDIYAFGDTGELQSFIHAERATVASTGTWQLSDVTRTLLTDGEAQTEHLASLGWSSFLGPDQVQLLILPPNSMPPVELYHYIHALKQQNHQVARLEQAFWSKVGIPLSMAAMVLVATPFVFGPPRARTGGQRLAIGAAIGIVFTLAQQIASSAGLLFGLNPAFAAILPSLLLIVATQYLYQRSGRPEHGRSRLHRSKDESRSLSHHEGFRDGIDVVETSEPVRRASEIEEITNLYVIHPVSSFLTPWLARLGITPNAVSLTGMAFGILAGFAYYHYQDLRWAVAGFVLMIAWHVMDGADGQLARLTHAQSELGKILDGICDYVTFIAVYSALAAALSRDIGGWSWLLAVVAGLCHAVQSAAYEAQRQEYSFWGLGRKSAELTFPSSSGPGGRAPQPMEILYRLYVGAQLLVSGQVVEFRDRLAAAIGRAAPDRATAIRARYREVFAPAVRHWSILSANYRTIGIFIATALGRPHYYFVFEIIGFSAILALLLAYQRSRCRLLFDSLSEAALDRPLLL